MKTRGWIAAVLVLGVVATGSAWALDRMSTGGCDKPCAKAKSGCDKPCEGKATTKTSDTEKSGCDKPCPHSQAKSKANGGCSKQCPHSQGATTAAADQAGDKPVMKTADAGPAGCPHAQKAASGSGCPHHAKTANSGCSSTCTPAEVGKAAPNFTLTALDGQSHSLSQYQGKVVVLEWTNFKCPYVVRHQSQAKTMQRTRDMFKGDDVVWLAVNSSYFAEDDADAQRSWVKANDVEYPVLLDADGKVGQLYQAKTTPHMFVIDREGQLVYSGAIDDDAYGNKDNARNYVAEAVKSLLAGEKIATSETKPYGCSVKYKKS